MNNPDRSEGSPWTILELLKWTTAHFTSKDVENPRASAEILLAHTLGCRRIDLYVRYEQPLVAEELSRFKSLIKRRLRREPVAYIVGQKEFWSLALAVTPDVLIPRPETEHLVELALRLMAGEKAGPLKVIDLGTGSGAVVIAVAKERPGNALFAVDRSLAALGIAKKNAIGTGVEGGIRFFCGDWFAALKDGAARFDLIIANPPYIPSDRIPELQPEVRLHEPIAALDGGPDGLHAIREIVGAAHGFLAPGGHLLMEIGHDQRETVRDIAMSCGRYADIGFEKDYGGHDRVVRMAMP